MTAPAWPRYLLDRAARPPPPDCAVVPRSTPVVSFGDPVRSRVATLSINPSSLEFETAPGRLLSDGKRRLATLDSLQMDSLQIDPIDDACAARIVDDCARYFETGNAYDAWFGVLDEILTDAAGASYRVGQRRFACHLDLVQWATRPAWGDLPRAQRRMLIAQDAPFLLQQLQHVSYELVLVNGRSALDTVATAGLVRWEPLGENIDDTPPVSFLRGQRGNTVFLAWSAFLQSPYLPPHRKTQIVAWLKKMIAEHAH